MSHHSTSQQQAQQQQQHHHQRQFLNPVEMIALRRENRRPNTDEELQHFISEYVQGNIPDYQMAAWLMAVCFHPLTPRETATLTRCYADSGITVPWKEKEQRRNHHHHHQQQQQQQQQQPVEDVRQPPQTNTRQRQRDYRLVDKHSSGGVGDKISLILAPLVAACNNHTDQDKDEASFFLPHDVWVPMMAGRGLGHTGGTIDKLETSFEGFNAALSVTEFQTTVETVGCAIVCATKDICPADQRLVSRCTDDCVRKSY
jgi:thymidine phosphorylase